MLGVIWNPTMISREDVRISNLLNDKIERAYVWCCSLSTNIPASTLDRCGNPKKTIIAGVVIFFWLDGAQSNHALI